MTFGFFLAPMARTKIAPKTPVKRWHLASDVNLGCTMAARRSAPGVGGFKRKRRAKLGVKRSTRSATPSPSMT